MRLDDAGDDLWRVLNRVVVMVDHPCRLRHLLIAQTLYRPEINRLYSRGKVRDPNDK